MLGNESCDLDSAASALVYGYYLHRKLPPSTPDQTDVIPVLNIPRAEYSLRTDIRHVLGRCGFVDDCLLTFRDDINLELLNASGRLKLTLVDFHVLSSKDASLDGAVVEVIDHRPRAQTDRVGYDFWNPLESMILTNYWPWPLAMWKLVSNETHTKFYDFRYSLGGLIISNLQISKSFTLK